MRYFWGFVQLQDMLDNAIIEMKTDSVSLCSWYCTSCGQLIVKWLIVLSKPLSGENIWFQPELAQVVQDGVFLQQFSYPCLCLIVQLVFFCLLLFSLIVQVVQDGVFLQQFPYPCFQRNNFLSGLYTIQLLPVDL